MTKEGYDFAYIHVEAPDEMGHQGSVERKVKAIEYLDSRIIKPVKEGLEAAGEDFRMLVLPDQDVYKRQVWRNGKGRAISRMNASACRLA